MAKISPAGGVNPGFTRVDSVFNRVSERQGQITIKGDSLDCTFVEFFDNGKLVASMTDANNALRYLILAEEGNALLGSLISEKGDYVFPQKGRLRSRPTGRTGKSASGRTFEYHDVILEDVKFAEFKRQ